MRSILDVWCDMCTHLQPFALMAIVPLLLWTWHSEVVEPQQAHRGLEGGTNLPPQLVEDFVMDQADPEGQWAA